MVCLASKVTKSCVKFDYGSAFTCVGSMMMISTKVQILWLQRETSTFWWHEWKKHRQLISNQVKIDFMCNGCKSIWHLHCVSLCICYHCIICCFALILKNTMLKMHPQCINKMCKCGAISQLMLVFILTTLHTWC